MRLTFPKHYIQSPNDNVGRAVFVAQYARMAGIDVRMVENTENVWMQRKTRGQGWIPSKGNHLSCLYEGKRLIFEVSDFPELGKEDIKKYSGIPYFKYHYNEELHGHIDHVFPIGPSLILPSGISSFQHYFKLRKTYKYACSTNIISNKQEPRRLALERRTRVQRMLWKSFGRANVDVDWRGNQKEFWNANKSCLVSVCVPGACNNMLDRGHYELLGLGVCTISPYIPTVLPWDKMFLPNQHYIKCRDDYKDLIEKIEWCKTHRDQCVEIGNNAKEMFDKYCTPEKYWEWIDVCIEKVYK